MSGGISRVQESSYNHFSRNRNVFIGSATSAVILSVLGTIAAFGVTVALKNAGFSKSIQAIPFFAGLGAVALGGVSAYVAYKAFYVNKLDKRSSSNKLVEAIRNGNNVALRFNLMIGADVDRKVGGKRPIVIAQEINNQFAVELLTKYKAKSN